MWQHGQYVGPWPSLIGFEGPWDIRATSEWYHHSLALRSQPRLTWRNIQAAKDKLQSKFVIHCEDHAANHLMVFCPLFYYRAAMKTWSDPEVFQQLPGTAQQHQQDMLIKIPADIKQHYRWAVDLKADFPTGFVLFKRKKAVEKGRTITRCTGFDTPGLPLASSPEASPIP